MRFLLQHVYFSLFSSSGFDVFFLFFGTPFGNLLFLAILSVFFKFGLAEDDWLDDLISQSHGVVVVLRKITLR